MKQNSREISSLRGKCEEKGETFFFVSTTCVFVQTTLPPEKIQTIYHFSLKLFRPFVVEETGKLVKLKAENAEEIAIDGKKRIALPNIYIYIILLFFKCQGKNFLGWIQFTMSHTFNNSSLILSGLLVSPSPVQVSEKKQLMYNNCF